MSARGLLKGAVEVAKRGKLFASGQETIKKFVPFPYQKPVSKLFKAFEQAVTGASIFSIYDELMNGFSSPTKQPQTNKFGKTHSRSKYNYRRNNRYSRTKTSRRCRHIYPCRC